MVAAEAEAYPARLEIDQPEDLNRLTTARFSTRVGAYAALLTDRYPPFSLS